MNNQTYEIHEKKMKKRKTVSLILSAALMLTGCTSPSSLEEKQPLQNVSELTVGNSMKVTDISPDYTFTADNSTLAADGLYYASWGLGGHEPYENSDGGTVELYDASLYLLLGESQTPASAQENTALWFHTAETNYKIVKTEEISCNGQDYTLITYNFTGTENPYARGMSAFATPGTVSVCVELTCREYFDGDLRVILTDFLDNCSYITDSGN